MNTLNSILGSIAWAAASLLLIAATLEPVTLGDGAVYAAAPARLA